MYVWLVKWDAGSGLQRPVEGLLLFNKWQLSWYNLVSDLEGLNGVSLLVLQAE